MTRPLGGGWMGREQVVIFDERHLRHVLSSYVDYYHRARTHLSLDKDCPHSRHSRRIEPITRST
jgi:hypothetical protein